MSASLASETGAREDGEEKQEDGERVKAAMSGYLPWEKDLEMLSLFQDKKVARSSMPMVIAECSVNEFEIGTADKVLPRICHTKS